MNLGGVRILDLSRYLPGPYATQLLADMGADIIKIERPGSGDPTRSTGQIEENGYGEVFNAVNRGKRSMTLDLKAEAGSEVFNRLVEKADIVFEQFRPGVADRLGVGFDDVRERNDQIIYCSLSGFGQDGPYSDHVGHDLNYLGIAGFLDMNRPDDDSAPVLPPFPVGDMAGGLFAAFSTLGTLVSRELGNQEDAEHIDVSITDVMVSFAQVNIPPARRGDTQLPGETRLTGQYPCYDVYETADGRYVTLAALEAKFWTSFCEAINRPDLEPYHLSEDPAIRREVRTELQSKFQTKDAATWVTELDQQEIPIGRVNRLTETLEDPQVEGRNLLHAGTGCSPRVGFPALTSTKRQEDESVPDLGEHTADVLNEYGFSTGEIETFRSNDVI